MEQVPIKIARQIAGKCLYSGCDQDALRDSKGEIESDYCGPHDAHERGRAANRQRRHRQKLADAGLCIAGCGRKVSRKRERGKVMRRRCSKCRKEHAAQERRNREKEKACVTGDPNGVTGDDAWRVEVGTHDWGSGQYQTVRYHGKGRPGRLTREQQLDETERRRRHAKEYDTLLARGIQMLKLPEVMELPVIQRGAASREVGQHALCAARTYLEIARALGVDDAIEIEDDEPA